MNAQLLMDHRRTFMHMQLSISRRRARSDLSDLDIKSTPSFADVVASTEAALRSIDRRSFEDEASVSKVRVHHICTAESISVYCYNSMLHCGSNWKTRHDN